MFLRELIAVVFLCVWHFSHGGLLKLNNYLLHYEGLDYDRNVVAQSHHRVKRSLTSNIQFTFNAHGQKFSLLLRPDSSTFSPTVTKEYGDDTVEPLDTSHMFMGELRGRPGSKVVGSIINGTFRGFIKTEEETFYIEPTFYYFKEPQAFHSIIYADSHLRERTKRSNDVGSCGYSSNRAWMERVANSAVHTREEVEREKRDIHREDESSKRNKYSEFINRQKRAVPTGRVCSLNLQSDPELWRHLKEETRKTDAEVSAEISSIFQTLVEGLKAIYFRTKFKMTSGPPNEVYEQLTFVVNKVKIYRSQDCTGATGNLAKLCDPYIDVSNFLNIHSLQDHSEFCLAYMFTYRDFLQGTLGLAWVGSSGRASGGICETHREYSDNGIITKKSLNTGIVTFLNYGNRVPTKVSILTFAHEVGHNFGSPHDFPAPCTPYTKLKDEKGNFIMFAQATSGDRQNNNQFSECSLNNITLVLDAVFNSKSGKKNCFKDASDAFCGNMIVEKGETCDCGFADQCTDTQCCIPRPNEGDANGACQLKSTASCSGSDPCCTAGCEYKLESVGFVCLAERECANASICNGTSAQCPAPPAKPNGTPCNENTQMCTDGECKDSICKRIGWEECSLTLDSDNARELCFVACKKDDQASCISTADKTLDRNAPALHEMLGKISNGTPIRKPAGAHCDNMQGYCDVYFKCRRVDADGPLARLKNLLFNPETLNEIREWIVVHWWAILLMGIGLIIFMGVFIKICAVHTPSSNPNKKPARQLTLPRRSRPRQANQPPDRHQPQPQSHSRSHIPQSAPPPYGAPSAPPGGPPPGKGKKRKAAEQKYKASDIEMRQHRV